GMRTVTSGKTDKGGKTYMKERFRYVGSKISDHLHKSRNIHGHPDDHNDFPKIAFEFIKKRLAINASMLMADDRAVKAVVAKEQSNENNEKGEGF
ncbi:hypothetical protein THAOC_32940, partial [Thalassiosira oceanica]